MMEIKLIRKIAKTKNPKENTIGELLVNGQHFGYTLEDVIRDTNHDGDLKDSGEQKVYGKTAIPCGRYEMALTWSNKFGKRMPLIMNVEGFEGIRIHGGNTEKDSLGCPLLGQSTDYTKVWNCRDINELFKSRLETALASGKVFIEIIDEQ